MIAAGATDVGKGRSLPGVVVALVAVAMGSFSSADDIRFSRDVLPILSDRCFHCHGPDPSHREADLRLDERESAIAQRDGKAAIVPGRPEDSEILRRIMSDDPDELMPPPASHRKPLSRKERETLHRWIAEGAVWGRHWAFERPVRPAVPAGAKHPIDAFVSAQLKEQGLKLSKPASRATLIRRLSFDLTGLPPGRADLQSFVADDSEEAEARLVDRLFKSPHYGERMAMWWLDAARYSDTDGFQADATRTNWPWRDWVIQSFNANKRFDQFTIEQFAGDLLPDAAPEQILATCFHRNHMTNGEGGRDPEESRIDYVIDRVNTTGTVWLGLTLGCTQCHSHKFDPISHQDYYSLFAFFDSIDEDGKAGTAAKPYLKFKSPLAQRAVEEAQRVVSARTPIVEAARQRADAEFQGWLASEVAAVQKDGFQPWRPLTPNLLESIEGTRLSMEADGVIQASGPNPRQDDYRLLATSSLPRITGLRLEVFPHSLNTDGKLSRGASGEFILTDVKLQVRQAGRSEIRDIDLESAVADVERDVKGRNYGKIVDTLDDDPRNGWTTESHDPKSRHVAVFALKEPLVLQADEELIFVMLHRSTSGDANIGRFRVSVTDQPGEAVRSLNAMPLEQLAAAGVNDPATIESGLHDRLFEQFLVDHAEYQKAKTLLDGAKQQLRSVQKSSGELNVMVLAERAEPRPTYILERGVWDKKGQEVGRAVPAAVLDRPPEQVRTRLDLAKWIVDRENPLTARVVVNHLWQLCFGAGLVRTSEDFGLQGEFPTHPDLLDWLAVELVESGWDLQHVLRLIVTSETYQQDCRVSAELWKLDPENRFLARGARFRLPSWMIRDAALTSSGLLNPALGGPPVFPYQPEGVWAENTMGRFGYEPSQGPAQFRRTVYAFWRRSSAPTFLFDTAQRRVCEVRARQTNTPLQALTLLNDATQLEASREVARRAIESSPQPGERLQFLFESIVSRVPSAAEAALLAAQLRTAEAAYRDEPGEAAKLLDFGQSDLDSSGNGAELAAYMVVASLVFNLDEAITHE
ncbi:Planctomycete cytochrome C [Caulifigura coniformis]|uniref:Planctomycete cytochrome C n=1 Tax=Caulifigura coniformis TaxID=2527983 RepID=A0A517SD92_9PLAN|nr:PSD1 and planctomycete cytochrome C domain-containing protein [Caulifigura coniformis]QDT54090.1 Planctomycete cytochrome C [Caulifigura coniformis]